MRTHTCRCVLGIGKVDNFFQNEKSAREKVNESRKRYTSKSARCSQIQYLLMKMAAMEKGGRGWLGWVGGGIPRTTLGKSSPNVTASVSVVAHIDFSPLQGDIHFPPSHSVVARFPPSRKTSIPPRAPARRRTTHESQSTSDYLRRIPSIPGRGSLAHRAHFCSQMFFPPTLYL